MRTCTLKVEGMACGACENRVQRVARKVDGVSEAAASHEHSTVRITYDPARTSPAAIAKAISTQAGFATAVEPPCE